MPIDKQGLDELIARLRREQIRDHYVTLINPDGPEAADTLKALAEALAAASRVTDGECECDSYHGFTCAMCRIRSIVRAALTTTKIEKDEEISHD